MRFCNSYIQFSRRKTSTAECGGVKIGSSTPIVVQSMCTTSTLDTESSVSQIIRIKESGADIVRLTAQGISEAENLKIIKEHLISRGCNVPLVADIHFNPNAAKIAARNVEKVRINPGNFVDKRATFTNYEYTEEEWNTEKKRLKTKLFELLDICVENKTAIRIGVNHGSLSDRIMSKYGDTAKGMTASAIEMLEMCEEYGFKNVVISMKSSNTHTMVHAYRMLCGEMLKRGMDYPLHLGVTEAGEGNDGRIRSAVGIGALMSDGIGDTIRVSLTEEPENEIPVAKKLVEYFSERENSRASAEFDETLYKYSEFTPRDRAAIAGFGGNNDFKVILTTTLNTTFDELKPDYTVGENSLNISQIEPQKSPFLNIRCEDVNSDLIETLKQQSEKVIILTTDSKHLLGEIRSTVFNFKTAGINFPIIVKREYTDSNLEEFQLKVAADYGVLLIDSLCDSLWIEAQNIDPKDICETAFSTLQSSRVRVTKTEYISCPGCGRTLYSLQSTLKKIKEATSSFKGVKIAVMGCIVNGPGEMADADYGYVGSGVGTVTLYKGKEVVIKNIDENIAVETLVKFINADKKWS